MPGRGRPCGSSMASSGARNRLIDHLGIDYFGSVVTVDLIPRRANDAARANDATLALVGQLGRLDHLRLTGTAVTDAGLVHLKGLSGLRGLQLGNTQITDAGLAHLKGLTELHELLLFNTPVTDAGLGHLQALPSLVLLDLAGTKVTDDGVIELERVRACHVPALPTQGTGCCGGRCRASRSRSSGRKTGLSDNAQPRRSRTLISPCRSRFACRVGSFPTACV